MAAATEDVAASREGRVELPGFEERGGVLKLKDVSAAGQDEGRNSGHDEGRNSEGEAGRAGGAEKEKDTEYKALVTLSEWFAVQPLTHAAPTLTGQQDAALRWAASFCASPAKLNLSSCSLFARKRPGERVYRGTSLIRNSPPP